MFKFKRKKIDLNEVPFIHKIGHDAHVDWLLVFFSTLILTVVLASVSYLLYNDTYSLREEALGKVASSKIIFDEKVLENVLKLYNDRMLERVQVEAGVSGQSDPSI